MAKEKKNLIEVTWLIAKHFKEIHHLKLIHRTCLESRCKKDGASFDN